MHPGTQFSLAIAVALTSLFQLSIAPGPTVSRAAGNPAATPPLPIQKSPSHAPQKPAEVRSDGYSLVVPEGAKVLPLKKSPMDLEIARARGTRDVRLAEVASRLAVTRPGPARDALQREAEEIKQAWELEVYAIQIAHARAKGYVGTVRVLEAATVQLKAAQQAKREAVRLATERARGGR